MFFEVVFDVVYDDFEPLVHVVENLIVCGVFSVLLLLRSCLVHLACFSEILGLKSKLNLQERQHGFCMLRPLVGFLGCYPEVTDGLCVVMTAKIKDFVGSVLVNGFTSYVQSDLEDRSHHLSLLYLLVERYFLSMAPWFLVDGHCSTILMVEHRGFSTGTTSE
uniref:Uncharacterized protein n=1 Tax=Cannabis sativa TaxID=3483 RepID=A0A803NJ65_CANSA